MNMTTTHQNDMPRITHARCDSDDFCVTPGQKRKVNVYYDHKQPVLYVCKGCARRTNKLRRERGARWT
jgi:MinD superfamily P-loop ATPase